MQSCEKIITIHNKPSKKGKQHIRSHYVETDTYVHSYAFLSKIKFIAILTKKDKTAQQIRFIETDKHMVMQFYQKMKSLINVRVKVHNERNNQNTSYQVKSK